MTAWLPPVLAAVTCGLQLTFWENATAGTKPMLNLLMFAYVIRCLLEYRLDKKSHWLLQSAFLVGLGMTNSHAFIGYFPVYVISLIWLKRASFFKADFLMPMALLGLAGLSLYLLLPLIHMRSEYVDASFFEILGYNLGAQKAFMVVFPKKMVVLMGLTSLLPILLISIRWPQSFGDLSPQGIAITTFLFHVVHAAFLVACIWIAFDPPVSPRNLGWGQPFLTFYYLGAIAVGYFAGYFMVVFGRHSEDQKYTYGRTQRSTLGDAVVLGVWLVAAATIGGLVFRSLPQIQMTNSSMLREYASLIAERIPEGRSIVLSDDTARELVLRSALTQRGDRPEALLLSTRSLHDPKYHVITSERHPGRWPVPPPTDLETQIVPPVLLKLMVGFSQSNKLCYAHPSFGYYFEEFHPEPQGILNLMVPFEEDQLLPDPITEQTVALNEEFWDVSARNLLESAEKGHPTRRPSNPGQGTQRVHAEVPSAGRAESHGGATGALALPIVELLRGGAAASGFPGGSHETFQTGRPLEPGKRGRQREPAVQRGPSGRA